MLKPLQGLPIRPLLYLSIVLTPLLRLMRWLSYRNGFAHLATKFGSFAGRETWAQVDYVARCQTKASPAVLARGMLGMMDYDASRTLTGISVPSLVVAGDSDSTTTPEASETIQRSIPRAKLVALSPAKHMGLVEHHERFAGVVRDFIHEASS
jgi:pimeloyl-ACP methyl ester carboxylesterase